MFLKKNISSYGEATNFCPTMTPVGVLRSPTPGNKLAPARRTALSPGCEPHVSSAQNTTICFIIYSDLEGAQVASRYIPTHCLVTLITHQQAKPQEQGCEGHKKVPAEFHALTSKKVATGRPKSGVCCEASSELTGNFTVFL